MIDSGEGDNACPFLKLSCESTEKLQKGDQHTHQTKPI